MARGSFALVARTPAHSPTLRPSATPFTPFDILRKNYDASRQAWREAQGTDAGSDICLNKIIHVAAARGA